MGGLDEVVKKFLDQGYSPDYIRKYLKSYGYKEEDIAKHFSTKTVKHEHGVSRSAMIFSIIFLVVLVGGIYFIIQATGFGEGDPLLDLEVEPRFTELSPGDELGFNIKIMNLGSKEKFDIFLKYEIFDGDKVVEFQEETIAVSTSVTRYKKIISPDEPGNYLLRITGDYEGKAAVASFSFSVLGEQNIEPEEPIKQAEEPEQDDSIKEILEEAESLSELQPSEAEKLCLKLESNDRDDCLSIVVDKARRPEFCNNIISPESRDNCFMTFIIEGQTHLCSEIDLESNKNYCNRINDVQILAKYYN